MQSQLLVVKDGGAARAFGHDWLLALLQVLNCDVDLVVRTKTA